MICLFSNFENHFLFILKAIRNLSDKKFFILKNNLFSNFYNKYSFDVLLCFPHLQLLIKDKLNLIRKIQHIEKTRSLMLRIHMTAIQFSNKREHPFVLTTNISDFVLLQLLL